MFSSFYSRHDSSVFEKSKFFRTYYTPKWQTRMRTKLLTRVPNWNKKTLTSCDVFKFLQPWWFTCRRNIKFFQMVLHPWVTNSMRTELLTRASNWNNKISTSRDVLKLQSWWSTWLRKVKIFQMVLHPWVTNLHAYRITK